MFGTRTKIGLNLDDWENHLHNLIKNGNLIAGEDEIIFLEFDQFLIELIDNKKKSISFKIYKNQFHIDMKKYLNNYEPNWSKCIIFNYCNSMNLLDFFNMIKDLKRFSKLKGFK